MGSIMKNVDLFTYRVVDGREGFTSTLSDINRLRFQVYVNEWGFDRARGLFRALR